MSGVVEGVRDGEAEGCLDCRVGSFVGVIDGKAVVGPSVGKLVGEAVGERVPPITSLSNDRSRPVVVSSAKASTYSASANKFSTVQPADKYRAIAPVTAGAAMDVPVLMTVALSAAIPAARIFLPGAHRLIQAPVLLVAARTFPSPTLPTAMTPGTRAGDRLQASSF